MEMPKLELKAGILEERRRYHIEEVSEPNLLRDIFPYTEVPRIIFDHRIVPMEPAKEMYITDTTFRDGQQARPPYTVRQIVDLYDMMHRLGGPNGIIRQCEFFLYSDKDKEAVRKCQELGFTYPEVTGWIRATKGDFQLVKEMGLQETGILTSASDYHIFRKLKMTRTQAKDAYLDLVRTALESGLRSVRCHLEDLTRADFYGFIVPYVQELMDLARESGKVIRIRLCDTMGYGVPYPEAALPRSVPKLVHDLIHEAGVPGEWLEWHGHNDFHKVLVNAEAAWLYGCAAANGTLLGFGERCGNPPIEGLIIEYIALRGDPNGIDTTVITEIGDYFKKEIGAEVPTNYPFVGDAFNTTSAGIHADGVLKDEEIYNIFDTTRLLNRPPDINVTDKSGLAGVAYWVNHYLGLTGDREIDKRHPGLQAIHEWVESEYKAGRVTSISQQEMLYQARLHLPEYFKSDYDRIKEQAHDLAASIVEDLVTHPEVHSMVPARVEAVLEQALEEHRFIQLAYVTDMKGHKITRNITQHADREKYETFGLGDDFSDRDWFIGAKAGEGLFITDFYKSKITDALCLTVSAPVKDPQTGEIKGILGVDIRFEDLVRRHV